MHSDRIVVLKISTLIVLIFGFVAFANHANAQVLRKMTITEVSAEESFPYVLRNPNEAVLIVHSNIAQLQFESTNQIIKVDDKQDGKWILHLRPGTHLITIKAEGYSSIQERFVIAKKNYKEIKVIPGYGSSEEVETGTIEFILDPGPVIIIQNGIQSGQFNVNNSGVFPLKLSPGEHDIQLVRDGNRVFSEVYEVQKGEVITDTVHFSSGNLKSAASGTGVLFVRSEPDKAMVFIDGAEAGETPLEIREIATGEHQIRIEKHMYKPVVKSFSIEADDLLNLNEPLEPDFGEITIRTNPSGAEVYLDNVYSERTPRHLSKVETGTHNISLRLSRFRDVSWNPEIKAGDKIDTLFEMPPAFGQLRIKSNPSGATVFLETDSIGITPLSLDTIMSGEYIIRLDKKLYTSVEENITIRDGELTNLNIPLDQNYGTLEITSDPSGMEVTFIDGPGLVGKTPLTYNIKPGSYTLKISDDLYEPFTQYVSIDLNETEKINAKLVRKSGLVKIFSKPFEAEIIIDGKKVGSTPILLKDYPTGEYEVQAKKMGYLSQTKTIQVHSDSASEYEFVLDRGCPPNKGIFDFSSLPNGIKVYHNNKLLGETPLSYMEVNTGEHKLEFARKYYESSGAMKYTIKDQQTIRPDQLLVPKSSGKAALRSFFLPGWGQFYSESKPKGILFIAAELASIGYLAYSYTNYQSKEDEYLSSIDRYSEAITQQQEIERWEEVERTFDSYSSASDQLTISFILPIAIHAANFFDALLFGGAPDNLDQEKRQYGIDFKPNNNQIAGVSFYVNF